MPSAPLNTFDEVFADPQVVHMKMKEEIVHKRVGKIGLVRNGVRMSKTPPQIHSASPELGEHTDEVLASLGLKHGAK